MVSEIDGIYRPPKVPCQRLADAPVVLLGPEQAVEEQDGRRPVRVLRDWPGRPVKVVGQRDGRDGARGAAAAAAVGAAVWWCRRERAQAARAAQSLQDRPCAKSKYHPHGHNLSIRDSERTSAGGAIVVFNFADLIRYFWDCKRLVHGPSTSSRLHTQLRAWPGGGHDA